VKPPFKTALKFMAVSPLPWGVRASAAFQSLPGPELSAGTIFVSNAAIAPSLGRPLSGRRTGLVLPLTQAGTEYGEQYNKLDVRFSKIVQIGPARLTGSLDIFNALNGAGVLSVNTRFGPAYLNPTRVLGARFFRISGQFDF
jgi:hypothetical protein